MFSGITQLLTAENITYIKIAKGIAANLKITNKAITNIIKIKRILLSLNFKFLNLNENIGNSAISKYDWINISGMRT